MAARSSTSSVWKLKFIVFKRHKNYQKRIHLGKLNGVTILCISYVDMRTRARASRAARALHVFTILLSSDMWAFGCLSVIWTVSLFDKKQYAHCYRNRKVRIQRKIRLRQPVNIFWVNDFEYGISRKIVIHIFLIRRLHENTLFWRVFGFVHQSKDLVEIDQFRSSCCQIMFVSNDGENVLAKHGSAYNWIRLQLIP